MTKILLLSAVLALTATPVVAQTITIDPSRALSGTAPLKVGIEGGGLNLDFSSLGERITSIMLDDMSRIGVSHCLMTKSCGNAVPPVIHLRRVNPIDFEHVPKAQQTLLTVVTVDRRNKWKTYQFPVTPIGGNAGYHKAEISRIDTTLAGGPRRNTGDLTLGIREAQRKGLLRDPALRQRLSQLVTYSNQGESLEDAAANAGVSPQLVQKLSQMGQLIQTTQARVEAPAETEPQDLDQSETIANLALAPIADNTTVTDIPPAPKVEPSPPPAPQSKPLEAMPKAAKSASKDIAYSRTPTYIRYANRLATGLNRARLNGEIPHRSLEWWRVNYAISTLRRGGSLVRAAELSRVPLNKLEQLIGLQR